MPDPLSHIRLLPVRDGLESLLPATLQDLQELDSERTMS